MAIPLHFKKWSILAIYFMKYKLLNLIVLFLFSLSIANAIIGEDDIVTNGINKKPLTTLEISIIISFVFLMIIFFVLIIFLLSLTKG